MTFPTQLTDILERVDRIDPVAYSRTRNDISGAVTCLSPYLSRGVLSTRRVFEKLVEKGWSWKQMEKLVQELAWRDYWQLVWKSKGDAIHTDMRNEQPRKRFEGMPRAVNEARTGIEAIDAGIRQLYATGYMHNHLRMYTAALCTSIGRYHWSQPARWMYYHLLDADWASNALSWQWVCGANSHKIYVANQENVNRYTGSSQRATYLDRSYEDLMNMEPPEVLLDPERPSWSTELPEPAPIAIDPARPTLVYNFYNLDPFWKTGTAANRILLLEPDHFRNYPVHDRTLHFVFALSENLPGLQVFVGSFDELMLACGATPIHFKEHPLNRHYRGVEEPRDWLAFETGDYPSFFNFWKKAERKIKSTTTC